MSTHLKAHNIWCLVGPGIQTGVNATTQRKYQLALSLIHQRVYCKVFGKTAYTKTIKEAWDILKLSYKRIDKAHKSKLQ